MRVTEPFTPGSKWTAELLNEVVGWFGESDAVALEAVTLAVRLTFPRKPLMPSTVTVAWPEEPTDMISEVGLDMSPKSVM